MENVEKIENSRLTHSCPNDGCKLQAALWAPGKSDSGKSDSGKRDSGKSDSEWKIGVENPTVNGKSDSGKSDSGAEFLKK
jgi:hypothetical protein